MHCPKCATPNAEESLSCVSCGMDFPKDGEAMPTVGGETAVSETPSRFGTTIPAGTILGNRYRILAAIDMGGMGMVYKAVDLELSVPVALKVIRGEYSGNEKILERFKREITIARKVTHKNVARIFDIGEADGIRYISMEFIEGDDLARVVERDGALPPNKVVGILRQCCIAMSEAHSQGIVHRDLKPHNVMIDPQGDVKIMDFGIAMSQETRGLTKTGAILGTAEYMSPEQAEGRDLDHRADIYSLGITIYEALTGTVPFSGQTQWEVIRKQMQDRPRPPRRLRAETPAWLETVILKCLEKDPAHRYQSVDEILRDIDRQKATRTLMAYMPQKRNMATVLVAGILVIVAATAAYMFRPKGLNPGPGGRLAVAVLPFDNQASREDLAWLQTGLAENLSTDLAQSKYLRVITMERLTGILNDLGYSQGQTLSNEVLTGIAEYAGVQAIFTGSFVAAGDMLRINLLAREPDSGEVIDSAVVSGSSESVLSMIDQLTVQAKQILQISPDKIDGDVDTAIASARTSSLEAASLFQQGVDLLYAGKNLEAVDPLLEATKQDPDFSLAYARLSQAYRNLGYDAKAEEAGEKALSRLIKAVDRVTLADRAMVRAVHAASSEDREGAIEAYTELLSSDPFNATVAYNLGNSYEISGQWDQAEVFYKKASELDENYAQARYAAGRIMILSGRPQESLAQFEDALNLYRKIGSKEGEAGTYQALCNAYIGLQDWDKALAQCDRSEKIKVAIGDKRGLAATYSSKSWILQVSGRLEEALEPARRDLDLSREIGDNRGTAISLTNLASIHADRGAFIEAMGVREEALELLTTLGDQAGQASNLDILGVLFMKLGRLDEAREKLTEARGLYENLGIENGIARTTSNQGYLAFLRGDLATATKNFAAAQEKWKELDSPADIAETQYREAQLAIVQGRYGTALQLARAALLDFETAGDKLNTTRCRTVISWGLLRSGDLEEASRQATLGAKTAKDLGNPLLSAELASVRAEIFFQKSKPEKATPLVTSVCDHADTTKNRRIEITCALLRSRSALASGDAPSAIAHAEAASRASGASGSGLLALEAELARSRALLAGKRGGASAAALSVQRKANEIGAGCLVIRSVPVAAEALINEGRPDRIPALAGELTQALDAASRDLPEGALRRFLDHGIDRAGIERVAAQIASMGLNAEAERLRKLVK
jgi:tetratricopeptide (TPR) repeat protein